MADRLHRLYAVSLNHLLPCEVLAGGTGEVDGKPGTKQGSVEGVSHLEGMIEGKVTAVMEIKSKGKVISRIQTTNVTPPMSEFFPAITFVIIDLKD